MDKRAKSEQFRKRRNNYFRRGYDTGLVCGTDVFVLFRKNGKFYTFTNMKEPVWPTEEDIQRNLVFSKTAADYETTSRTKNKASKAKTATSRPLKVSENVSTFSTLGIQTPESPLLELSSQGRLRSWRGFITSLVG